MRGITTNPRQVAAYMRERAAGCTQQQAADRAGICKRTGKKIEQSGQPARGPRTYRTRADAFAEHWQPFVEPLLNSDKPLLARTMFAALQQQFPGRFADKLLRTFERRVRAWRALHGPDRETFFPQEHPPGWQGIMDFTVCNDLQVTIGGEPLPHRLCHFRLACSGWSFAHVILGGEKPAFLITNDFNTPIEELVGTYARRWRVENGIAEAVNFFNLNALSSPILIKVHFDVVMTAIADTLYTMLARHLRGFEDCHAGKISRLFVRNKATIVVDKNLATITFPRRAHNPILRAVPWANLPMQHPLDSSMKLQLEFQ